MSLQIETLSIVVVGIAIGLVFGFIFTMRTFRSSVTSIVTELVGLLTNDQEEDFESLCTMCPFSDDEEEEEEDPIPSMVIKNKKDDVVLGKDYVINGSIRKYVHEAGYQPTDLEDEK